MFKSIILTVLLFVPSLSFAEKINALPFEYTNFQYAGNIGFIGIGGGNTFFNDHYDFEVYFGFTPKIKYISEVAVVSLAIKNNYIPYTFKMKQYTLRPYLGIGLLVGANHRYNPNWQDSIDNSYYYQNNWHIVANLGLIFNRKFEVNQSSALGFYVESSTLDVYAVDFIQNPNALDLNDIFSLAFGIRMTF